MFLAGGWTGVVEVLVVGLGLLEGVGVLVRGVAVGEERCEMR